MAIATATTKERKSPPRCPTHRYIYGNSTTPGTIIFIFVGTKTFLQSNSSSSHRTMIFLQKKGGKVLKQVDEKMTPEEAAQEVVGRTTGFTCFATDGYRLEPRRSFSEQGISAGETVLVSMPDAK